MVKTTQATMKQRLLNIIEQEFKLNKLEGGASKDMLPKRRQLHLEGEQLMLVVIEDNCTKRFLISDFVNTKEARALARELSITFIPKPEMNTICK